VTRSLPALGFLLLLLTLALFAFHDRAQFAGGITADAREVGVPQDPEQWTRVHALQRAAAALAVLRRVDGETRREGGGR